MVDFGTHANGTINITGEIVFGGKRFVISGLRLLSGEIAEGKLRKPRFDFRAVKLDPGIDTLVRAALDVDDSMFTIGGLAGVPDGLRFELGLRLDALGGEVPGIRVVRSGPG